MQVILTREISNLGEIGEVVVVRPGYARNYLIPKGLAVVADARQVKRLEHEKRVIEARVAKDCAVAQGVAGHIGSLKLSFQMAAGENDKLFGSVTSMDLEAKLRERGIEVSRRQIQLSENIKALGDYEVPVKLHRDVTATLKIQVTAKVD